MNRRPNPKSSRTAHQHCGHDSSQHADLAQVHKLPRRRIQPGTIYTVRYPFREVGAEWKSRPAIVISDDGDRVRVAEIGSGTRAAAHHLVQLPPTTANGLDRRSFVTGRVTYIDRFDLLSERGTIDPSVLPAALWQQPRHAA